MTQLSSLNAGVFEILPSRLVSYRPRQHNEEVQNDGRNTVQAVVEANDTNTTGGYLIPHSVREYETVPDGSTRADYLTPNWTNGTAILDNSNTSRADYITPNYTNATTILNNSNTSSVSRDYEHLTERPSITTNVDYRELREET